MKKIVLSFVMLCCFALTSVAQQNALNGISVKTTDFTTMAANDRDMVVLTYLEEDPDQITLIGVGMGFSWGAMFPASMLAQYAGTQLIGVPYFDCGSDYAGTYEVRIYLGGDTEGNDMVAYKSFQIDGIGNDQAEMVPVLLDTPVNIDGTQNLWVMFYQDGSVQMPAIGITDLGIANNRWVMVDGYGWFDLASIGGSGYSWLIMAYLDGYDMIGEGAAEVNVYPNPTSSFVTVQANGMNHITVLNTIGQVVYDANVDSSLQTLDMSQYEAGVYMVRVATENGTSVQRVVVK